MILLIVAAYSAFQLPEPRIGSADKLDHSLPNWVLREEDPTVVDMQLFVDSKGRVLECEAQNLIGAKDVAEEMCRRMIGKRIRRGVGFDGRAKYGLTNMIASSAYGEPSGEAAALLAGARKSLVLTVNRLPVGRDGAPISSIPLNLQIDYAGAVAKCEGPAEAPKDLVETTCEQVSSRKFDIRSRSSGVPVPYIMQFPVAFEMTD